MNEMKPEDIYKWLDEIANNENLKQCSGIPSTAEAALALLREKDAEIDFLKATKNLHEAEYNELIAKVELNDAEIERLSRALELANAERVELHRKFQEDEHGFMQEVEWE